MGDCRTGEINSLEHFRESMGEEEFDQFIKPVEELPLHALFSLEKTGRAKIGRNDPCFCGSWKKFKYCCIQTPQPAEKSLIVAPW